MSSPPPPNPPTTTSAAAGAVFSNPTSRPPTLPNPYLQNPHHQHPYHQPTTAAAFPPPTQRQQHPQQPIGYSNSRIPQQQSSASKPQDSNQGVLYPVASSGNRGFLPKPHHHQSTDQNAAAPPNSGGFPPRPLSGYSYRPFGGTNPEISGQTLHHLVRPSAHSQQTIPASSGNMVLPSISKGVLVSGNQKVIPPSSAADGNNIKDSRDKSGDDALVTIRDRKVQISEGSSLYAQCRSWLKNGNTEENQTQYVESVRSLPKPLPASLVGVQARQEDDDNEQEDKKTEEDVENLSAKELLQLHVEKAKKVRARLRDHRLQRIERYKGRLALLLPPVVEQQQKNDSASGSGN